MNKDTPRPNGDEVRRLRLQRGWTQEDLAHKAGCGKRTIERAEKGNPARITMLRFIAEALGVEVRSILAPQVDGEREQQPTGEVGVPDECPQDILAGSQVAVAVGLQGIQVRFPDDFKTWNRERQRPVMAAIAQLLGMHPADLDVRDLSEGSVLLTLALPPEEVEKLLRAVQRGDLASIGAEDAKRVELGSADRSISRRAGTGMVPKTDESVLPPHLNLLAKTAGYVLGQSSDDARRLEIQDAHFAEVSERLLDDLALRPNDRVVEFGCGPGGFSRRILRRLGEGGVLVGVDAGEGLLIQARKTLTGLGPARFEPVLADLSGLALPVRCAADTSRAKVEGWAC